MLRREGDGQPMSINDDQDKHWVAVKQNEQGAELIAMSLQGPNISQQVTLLLSCYKQTSDHGSGLPVVLGIKGTNYFVSCSGPSDSPVLKLETVVNPEESLKTISTSSDMTRFLFYKREDQIGTSAFESFRFPGWFISNDGTTTRVKVAMCNGRQAIGRVTDFHIHASTQ
ncbi:interleukin-1 beta-like [Acipenser oxyrinchus oxyrinchus]|uniref:Interleukin-1 n=1 Tax=Acipenser oxyrinchus oxyrinchus TaxID=40147 RepID=A0AAD8CMP2_ACIOX|nr:interleukin-1 beta-like [Acipenser oxyrinchus oxyrinchus]